MIDLLCLVEFTWISLWLASRTRMRMLLYSVAIFTSGIAANPMSKWVTRIFAPPGSEVFKWLENHVTSGTQSVVLHSFIPPETAAVTSAAAPAQWIAYSILKTLLFVALTLSIFSAFVIIGQLVFALWDTDTVELSDTPSKPLGAVLGALSAFYFVLLSTIALGNLAWLKNLSGLDQAIQPSLIMHLTAVAITWLKIHSIS